MNIRCLFGRHTFTQPVRAYDVYVMPTVGLIVTFESCDESDATADGCPRCGKTKPRENVQPISTEVEELTAEVEQLKAARDQVLLDIHQVREWIRRDEPTAAMVALKQMSKRLNANGTDRSTEIEELRTERDELLAALGRIGVEVMRGEFTLPDGSTSHIYLERNR